MISDLVALDPRKQSGVYEVDLKEREHTSHAALRLS